MCVSLLILAFPLSALPSSSAKQKHTSVLLQVIIGKKDRNVQYDSYIIQLINYPGEMRREGIRMSISSAINRRNNFQLHKVYVVWSQQDLQLEGKNERHGSKE